MTRHNLKLCTTKELSSYIKRHNVKTIPEQINMAWGLDNDGYFLQLWFYDHDSHDDIYIEDGLMGESKNHILGLRYTTTQIHGPNSWVHPWSIR